MIQQHLKFALALLVLLILHAVGLFGMSIEMFRTVFQDLSAINLILSAVIVWAFHRGWSRKLAIALLSIAVLGVVVEMIGVSTGMLFGSYHYGTALGWSVGGVPLVIGLNWALLVYITAVIVRPWTKSWWFRAALGSTLMVLLDFPLEQVAPMLDFWFWDGGSVGVQNFVAWFLTGFGFHVLLIMLHPEPSNRMAWPYFVIVLAFFVLLNFV